MRDWIARLLVLAMVAAPLFAQNSATVSAEADRAEMMRRLGIAALIPGPSGEEHAPDHANYDEAKANPYPALPDVLTTNDGRAVTTPELWWQVRRPEIVEALSREVYGRVPAEVPAVRWRVVAE